MISIVIPTYEQQGQGANLLTGLLNSIRAQRVTVDYDIHISDSAKDGSIKAAVDQFTDLPINYHVSPVYGASVNINNAISLAHYDKVKIMCQDDLFNHPQAIDLFCKALDNKGWVISNSIHINAEGRHTGRRNAMYQHGKFDENTVGMPSVTAFRKCDIRFRPDLKTVCDMYFYHQLYELYGEPGVIREAIVAQRYHNASLSRNQPSYHMTEVNRLIREGAIPGELPKVVVSVVFHDRIENVRLWCKLWNRFKPDAELVFIHNDNGVDYSDFITSGTYINRHNPTGYDIGAFRDMVGFLKYDYLLWCTDDTVPMQPDFIQQYVDLFDKRTGIVCMHLSTEVTPHVRTTGFMISKELGRRLVIAPVKTREDCLRFEYKGSNNLMRQAQLRGYKIRQVAPLPYSPMYDMNYWSRNENAIRLRHLLDRSAELNRIMPKQISAAYG